MKAPPEEMSDLELLADFAGYIAGRENLGYHPEVWETWAARWMDTPRGKETIVRMAKLTDYQKRRKNWRLWRIVCQVVGHDWLAPLPRTYQNFESTGYITICGRCDLKIGGDWQTMEDLGAWEHYR